MQRVPSPYLSRPGPPFSNGSQKNILKIGFNPNPYERPQNYTTLPKQPHYYDTNPKLFPQSPELKRVGQVQLSSAQRQLESKRIPTPETKISPQVGFKQVQTSGAPVPHFNPLPFRPMQQSVKFDSGDKDKKSSQRIDIQAMLNKIVKPQPSKDITQTIQDQSQLSKKQDEYIKKLQDDLKIKERQIREQKVDVDKRDQKLSDLEQANKKLFEQANLRIKEKDNIERQYNELMQKYKELMNLLNQTRASFDNPFIQKREKSDEAKIQEQTPIKEKNEFLISRAEQLQEQNRKLQQDTQNIQQQNENLLKTLQESDIVLKKQKTENETLQKKLSEQEIAIMKGDQYAQQLENITQQFKFVQEEYDQLFKENQKNQQKAFEAITLKSKFDKSIQENQILKNEIAQLKKFVESPKAQTQPQLFNSSNLDRQYKDLLAKINILESENKELKEIQELLQKKLTEKEKDFESYKQKLQQENDKIQSSLNQTELNYHTLKQQETQLIQEMKDLQEAQISKDEQENYEQLVNDLRKQIDVVEQDRNKWENKFKRLEHDLSLNQNMIDDQKREISNLTAIQKESQKTIDKLELINKQLNGKILNLEASQQNSARDKTSEQEQALKALNEKQVVQIGLLEKEVEELREKQKDFEQQNQEFQQSLKDEQQFKKLIVNEQFKKQIQYELNQMKLQNQYDKIGKLNKENQNLKQEIEKWKQEIEDLKRQLEDHEQNNNNHQNQNLLNELEQISDQKDMLEQKNRFLMQDLRDWAQKFQNLEKNYRQLREENQKVEQDLITRNSLLQIQLIQSQQPQNKKTQSPEQTKPLEEPPQQIYERPKSTEHNNGKQKKKISDKIQKIHEMLLDTGIYGGHPVKKNDLTSENDQTEILEKIYERTSIPKRKTHQPKGTKKFDDEFM